VGRQRRQPDRLASCRASVLRVQACTVSL
jgi:hypothetical protein